jgi:hypothetical protein
LLGCNHVAVAVGEAPQSAPVACAVASAQLKLAQPTVTQAVLAMLFVAVRRALASPLLLHAPRTEAIAKGQAHALTYWPVGGGHLGSS